MRKVVLAEFLSLDGVAEEPRSFVTEWDEDVDAFGAELISTQDAVVLGRRSYDEWAEFWPDSPIQPFADFINRVPKFVATSSALDRPWANSTAIEGDPSAFVRELKAADGGDIGVHGSISLARSLLRDGVVDELRLAIAPQVAARGRRLLDEVVEAKLENVRTTVSPTGYLLAVYRVVP
ncbi:MAG TPA: dihydrofolate reductase family protein [Acidimicrobiales bacterium]|nr:dihydrofolate reductase family protein [Acidimicrobiales bacterium]